MTTSPDTPGAQPAIPGARFDAFTGAELRPGNGAGEERRESFALQTGEPVFSFNMVSSLMPLASGTAPQTYRWALALGILVPVLAGLFGFLAFAFVAAALVVPAIYVVYMYDVNEWEDQPVPVVIGTIVAAAALGVGFTFLWHAGILGDTLKAGDLGDGVGVDWRTLLTLVLLVPVVGLLLQHVGPLFLSTRPQFDDLIDALTFGVAAGAAFAAAETIVVNRALFSSFGHIDDADAGFWVSLVLSAAIVKPIVYGAATGIALAGFSGIGSGYEGFKRGYWRGLAEAVLALVVFQGGLYAASQVDGRTGAILGLVWGALVAAALIIRLRYLLHFAVIEAALESARAGTVLKDSAVGTAHCPTCEMPLLGGANFCVACGTSVRAGSKVTRTRNRTDDADPATSVPLPGQPAPRDNSKTVLVVGSVVAVIALGGLVGQAAAAAASEELKPPTAPIEVAPEVGAGPETEPAPDPADVPGPTPDDEVSEGAAPSSFLGSGGLQALGATFTTDLDTDTDSDVTEPPTDGGDVTEPPVDGGDTGAGVVEVGAGIGFLLPDGWQETFNDGSGFAVAGSQKGEFAVQLTTGANAEGLITANLEALQSIGIQDLEITEPEALALPTSSLVSAHRLFYRGLLASQQGGAIPVEGVAFYFVRQDGMGVTAFGLYNQGAMENDQQLIDDYNLMINTLVSTL
ncbi:hypothetical protein [Nocardioides sp. SYSU D00038]|uniref:hypothetical protein n=1 Tax=Nocardioides sp. SYSU D00038 TaxID=2812554 RepID=UPI0019677E67|nr:hypothetical protein [Nocardioides sp. SYSU D00038]